MGSVTRGPAVAPFLKWAGSKRHLLRKILPCIPEEFNRYFEPFLGGGSLFFTLSPRFAQLSDINQGLIETFSAIRDDVERVIESMKRFEYSSSSYYSLRDETRPSNRWEAASRFITLNKTCWNGLYRENSAGKFNVPFGGRESYTVDEGQLRAASRALKGISIACCDFERALRGVSRDDFVFLDPPYVNAHQDNGFFEYNARLFDWTDQLRLLAVCKKIQKAGATFVMTNAAHSSIDRLYAPFERHRFRRMSTIAADAGARKRCEETIIIGGRH